MVNHRSNRTFKSRNISRSCPPWAQELNDWVWLRCRFATQQSLLVVHNSVLLWHTPFYIANFSTATIQKNAAITDNFPHIFLLFILFLPQVSSAKKPLVKERLFILNFFLLVWTNHPLISTRTSQTLWLIHLLPPYR